MTQMTQMTAATKWSARHLRHLYLSLFVLFVCLAGCGGQAREPVPEAPQRIIAVAPSIVEIVFGLGMDDRVVGVGDYALWPPEVFSKPRIGGLFDVRLEKIVELGPDLAILLPGEEKLAAQMDQLGIEVLTVQHESLYDVEASILAIAERLGVEAGGRQMAAAFRRDLKPQPLRGSSRVMLTITRDAGNLGEILVAGPGTFYDELLERLGVINAFAGAELSYPRVGAEGVVRSAPQAIVELQPKLLSNMGERRLLDDWRELPRFPAVDQGCLRIVAGDHVLLPGPRVTRLYRELRAALASCPAFSG